MGIFSLEKNQGLASLYNIYENKSGQSICFIIPCI